MNMSQIQPSKSLQEGTQQQRNSALTQDREESLVKDEHLEEFKKNIEISRSKLVEIIENDQFSSEAEELNRKAVELINQGYTSEGCLLLSEAEKVLQYAANRGKEINRNLIVAVLHNQAFCYQQNWSLQKCSNYVQALIYNINCELKTTEQEKQGGLILIQSLHLRRSLVHYYLLFCAINSQLKRNDAALIAAKKANALLKINSQMLHTIAGKARLQNDSNIETILLELSRLESSAQNLSVTDLLSATIYFYQIWKNKCGFPNHQLRNLIDKLKEFSIGNVMQMEPLEYHGQSCEQPLNISIDEILQKVVYISISYFTMATELRLLAVRLAGSKQEARDLSEYRQSQCYHLIAIILILYYLPFEILYLKHILASFKTHYQIDLQELESSNSIHMPPGQMFEMILTPNDKEQEFKESTAGNSQKGHSSGRNSFEDKKSHLNKLESYVRASLKGQNYDQHQKDLARLNNYYYVRGDLKEQKEKVIKKQKSSRSSHRDGVSKRKSFMTSKNSTQKTPVGHTPNKLSPKKSKHSSKNSKEVSKLGSIDHTLIQNQNKMSVMQEYFQSDVIVAPKKNSVRSKSKKKNEGSKENKDYLGFTKIKKAASPKSHTWMAKNMTNQMVSRAKSKENNDLKTLKSTSKKRGKLLEARSKKKTTINRQI